MSCLWAVNQHFSFIWAHLHHLLIRLYYKNLFITRLSFNIYNTYIESSPGIESRCIYIQYLSQILVNLGLVITISWRDPNDDEIPIKKDSHWLGLQRNINNSPLDWIVSQNICFITWWTGQNCKPSIPNVQ